MPTEFFECQYCGDDSSTSEEELTSHYLDCDIVSNKDFEDLDE
mgnify:CR=1 FL=1